jgi:hypothetical protein
MFSESRHKAFVLAVILSLLGCTPALYMPSAEDVTGSSSLPQLLEGRKLYIEKCGGCHTLILPGKHSASEWRFWVDSMQVKAKINHSEKELILKYLEKK